MNKSGGANHEHLKENDDYDDDEFDENAMECDDVPPKQHSRHQLGSPTSSTVASFADISMDSSTSSSVFSAKRALSFDSCASETSDGVNRLLWDSAAIYSDSRPPSNFVVYNASCRAQTRARSDEGPPLFDGGVANSTPPPMGGITAGPSGGSGTILHLACALDSPMALALTLAMGADARSTHTAFRRLMIHEAACNGSIQCLTLLLELGRSCAATDEEQQSKMAAYHDVALPESARASREFHFFADTSHYPRVRPTDFQSRGAFGSNSTPQTVQKPKGDFLQFLKLFREYTAIVKNGKMTELDAARVILSNASLAEPSRVSLAHSCTFQKEQGHFALSRGIFRPRGGGCADGHGNTPLHWAAFKNEVDCVSLLLKFNADPNARAHPSGWTPLHDAAYSNSRESIALLISSGAEVDARANSGATPLCFAAQEDAAGAAQLLLEKGADLTTRCAGGPYLRNEDNNANNHQHHPHSRFSGYTPLHYCAHYNAHGAARVLLGSPAAKRAMEISDLSERLPIHVAVARGSSDVLRELLHAGARVETPRSRDRVTAFAQSRSESFQSTEVQAAAPAPVTPTVRRREPPGRVLATPIQGTPNGSDASVSSSASVASPVLRSLIPAQPITSSKPWNCLSQRSIDECRELIAHAEKSWTPERHLLFTPADRKAVMELLRVGKRLELNGSGIFIDLWPLVLSFCGRGWFEVEKKSSDKDTEMAPVARLEYQQEQNGDDDYLMMPSLR